MMFIHVGDYTFSTHLNDLMGASNVCQNLTGENNANASARMLSFFVYLYMSAMGTQGGRLAQRSVRVYKVCTE